MVEHIDSNNVITLPMKNMADAVDIARHLAPHVGDRAKVMELSDNLRRLNDLRERIKNMPDNADALAELAQIEQEVLGGNPAPMGNRFAALINIVERTENTVKQNAVAALYDAIDSYSQLSAVSRAIVDAQWQAIQDGDIVVIAKKIRSPVYDTLPPEVQADIDATSVKILETPAMRDAVQKLAEDPKGKEALSDIQLRRDKLAELIANESDPQRRKLFEGLMTSNAFAMPAMNDFLKAVERGDSTAKLEQASTQVYNQVRYSFSSVVPAIRQMPSSSRLIDMLASHSKPEEAALLRSDTPEGNLALTMKLLKINKSIKSDESKAAWSAYGRVDGDIGKLTPREQEIIITQTLMASATSAVTIQGAMMQLGHVKELEQRLASGESLSNADLAHIKNLATINNKDVPLLDRATLLVESTVEAMTAAGGKMGQVNRSKASNTALAALTLVYTDLNGGIERFQQMAANPTSRDAQAYFAEYQNHLSRSLLNQAYDPNSPSQASALALALERTGTQMLDKTIVLYSTDTGLQKRDRYGYVGTSYVYDSAQGLLGNYLTFESINSALYKNERGEIIEAGPRAEAAQLLNQYRLFNTADGQKLISEMSSGSIAPVDALERASQLVLKAQAEMQVLAPSISDSIYKTMPERYAYMQTAGGINPDGTLNVGYIMDAAVRAERKYEADPVDRRNDSIESLRALDAANPPQAGDISYEEARYMRQTASQLQAVSALQTIRDMGTKIAEFYNAPEGGHYTEQMVLDEILYFQIVDAEHFSVAERRSAVYEVLSRDNYLGDPSRKALLDRTTDMIVDLLKDNPEYLLNESNRQFTSVPAQSAPAVDVGAEPVAPVAPVGPVEPAKLDERENEGSKGALDKLHKTDLEKAIIAAVQNLSPETRSQMLGDLSAIKEVNTGDLNFISYNEIESALVKLRNADGGRVSRPEHIVDVNGNGFDIEDIRAALTPAVNGPVQSNGR